MKLPERSEVIGTKYLIKLKWWIHCSPSFFRHWTAKLLITCVCVQVVVFRPAEQTDWVFDQPFWSNNRMKTRLGWFSAKKRPGTRAITNSGQLQNNCPLFVWQNQDNFMQSVIIILTVGGLSWRELGSWSFGSERFWVLFNIYFIIYSPSLLFVR